MALRRYGLVLAAALTLSLAWPAGFGRLVAVAATPTGAKTARSGDGQAESARAEQRPRTARRSKRARKVKVCKRRKGKRRCRWIREFSGHNVRETKLRTEPLPRPAGDIDVISVNHREAVTTTIYGPDGALDDEALAQLDRVFRCKRSGRVRAVDPRLYEILARVYEHFGRQRIELMSGFRYRERSSSRHFHGAAMDIRIPGVSYRKLADFVESLDTGNLGIGRYPTSRFVHVDIRAPGTKSYRWVDYSGSDSGKKKSRKRKRREKPSPRKTRPTS